MKLLTFRSVSLAAAALALASSANALTIDWSKLQGTSTMAFSPAAIALFQANQGVVGALGNTTAILAAGAEDPWTFSLPITSITITPALKIGSGQASGSALEFVRSKFDRATGTVIQLGLVLANFTIDYTNKKVLADATPFHGKTSAQAGIFDFHVATPLALKYKFPLSITGHEVLDKLTLTSGTADLFISTFELQGESVHNLVRATDFGTLTQDIAVKARKPGVSKTPYVPAP